MRFYQWSILPGGNHTNNQSSLPPPSLPRIKLPVLSFTFHTVFAFFLYLYICMFHLVFHFLYVIYYYYYYCLFMINLLNKSGLLFVDTDVVFYPCFCILPSFILSVIINTTYYKPRETSTTFTQQKPPFFIIKKMVDYFNTCKFNLMLGSCLLVGQGEMSKEMTYNALVMIIIFSVLIMPIGIL